MSVKTFVLSVASAAGLTIVLKGDVYTEWTKQFAADSSNCFNMDLDDQVSLHYDYDENVLKMYICITRCSRIWSKNRLIGIKIILVLLW